MYHIRFKGSYYDAGYRWGNLLYEHGKSLEFYPTFAPDEARKSFAKQCEDIYRKYYPGALEEIQGIADGQRLPALTVETIIFSMYCFCFDNHCTCFAFSENGETVFGRNSDFLVSIEKLYMNSLYALDGVYSFNGNTTAYVEMEDGVNERGLAAGLCFVPPVINKPGLNSGMLVRCILEKCATTAEAIDALKELPLATSQTLTFADRTGDIATVECNPEKITVIRPENGYNSVAAANCFITPEMSSYQRTDIDDWRAGERLTNVKNALNANNNHLTVPLAKDILAGKYGFTCQYDRKTNADTVWSVVYDLKRKQIWRTEGNPSRKAYKEDTRFKIN